jgi:hypothetical protein
MIGALDSVRHVGARSDLERDERVSHVSLDRRREARTIP